MSALGLKDPVTHFESHGIGLTDGSFFDSPSHVRLNFGCPRSMLEDNDTKWVRRRSSVNGSVARQSRAVHSADAKSGTVNLCRRAKKGLSRDLDTTALDHRGINPL